MHRRFLMLVAVVLLAVSCNGGSEGLSDPAPSLEPDSDGASVEHRTWQCDVSWVEGFLMVDGCDIHNVRYPTGEYTVTLRGQIPKHRLAAFRESGVREREVVCWVNYLFIEGERGGPDPVDPDPEPVVSRGVRYFTSDGMMTEKCHFQPQK